MTMCPITGDVSTHAAPTFFSRVRSAVRSLFSTEKAGAVMYLPTEVRRLPDRLLLDIGIDPRLVPPIVDEADEAIFRPGFAQSEVGMSSRRTTALS